MTIDESEAIINFATRLIKESEHWGKWEVRVDGSPERPWLRDISIVHSHDGDDYPILHFDCSPEVLAPELADRIVSLNNDLVSLNNGFPALLSALLSINTWQLRTTARATKTVTETIPYTVKGQVTE